MAVNGNHTSGRTQTTSNTPLPTNMSRPSNISSQTPFHATTLPSRDAATPRTFVAASKFKISTQKLPILKAGPIEAMTEALGIAPPEMIFGDNFITIEHIPSGWAIRFDAFGALDRVDKTGEKRLKVAYSKEWAASRDLGRGADGEIKEVVRPFDWSYSTDFAGTETLGKDGARLSANAEAQIPLELLKRPDPIQFFDDVILYEDELADNGIAMLSVKIRVMPARLLLLSRFFMRLDGVLLRVRDTRVFVEFSTREVIREYVAKESEYEKVREMLAGRRDDVSACMRDAGMMAEMLEVVERQTSRVVLPG